MAEGGAGPYGSGMRRSSLLTLASASLALAAAAPSQAASFDCRRAATADERAVCADPQLSELDDTLQAAFEQARRSDAADARDFARGFLADRRACGADRACLLAGYVGVLTGLRDRGARAALPSWATAEAIAGKFPPASPALPTRIGRCAATQVAAVTPRLDPGRAPRSEDYDSGTAINFRNGGRQVSYAREQELLRSKPGDPVLMCLVSIPHGCPPGDDRGRLYMVTNQRTSGTWTLSDSQHVCGGA